MKALLYVRGTNRESVGIKKGLEGRSGKNGNGGATRHFMTLKTGGGTQEEASNRREC